MAESSIEKILQSAARQYQAGRLVQAEEIYRRVLARQPDNELALFWLGALSRQLGRSVASIDFSRRAIQRRPAWPEAYFNLGLALADAERFDHAIAAYKKAIELRPDFVQAYGQLGIVLRHRGLLDQAIEALTQAVRLQSDLPTSHRLLALAYRESGQIEPAIQAYRTLILLTPRDPAAHHALGLAYRDNHQPADALMALRTACRLDPASGRLQHDLGLTLEEMQQWDEAGAAFGRALELQPDLASAYGRLGVLYKRRGHLDQAVAACQKAIQLQPDFAQPYLTLASALAGQRKFEAATSAARAAIQLEPDSALAHLALATALREIQPDAAINACQKTIDLQPDLAHAHALLGLLLNDKGEIDAAIEAWRHAIALDPGLVEAYINLSCTFLDRAELDDAIAMSRRSVDNRPDVSIAHANLLYALHFHPGYTTPMILAEHRRWAARHADALLPEGTRHPNEPAPDRALKVGYVSADFRTHPVGRFLLPLLECHDHQNFKIHCYSDVKSPDEQTGRLRRAADAWIDSAPLSDEELAARIRQDGIDILIDLTLHAEGSRLLCFARKPAPIQAAWLGYAGTTGLRAIDYRISDPFVDPPGTENQYVEQTFRIPCYWCYRPMNPIPHVASLPALQQPSLTFGCLNKFYKVNEPLLQMWSHLLQCVENSRLTIHCLPGPHRDRVRRIFRDAAIHPDRLIFVPRLPAFDYLGQYQQIDIALDTTPFAGGTTTCDALSMGVPVVTLQGSTGVGRIGASILNHLQLPHLIAQTPAEYVDIAVRLAADLPALATLRAQLRERLLASRLCNATLLARDIESAYRQMWKTWCGI